MSCARAWPRWAVVAPIALALVAGASGAGRHQHKRGRKKPAPAAAPAVVPFSPGERLEYAAQWNKFVTAATLKVTVVERREFFGRPAWHFRALAQTIDPVRMLYQIDDQFDSYTDAVTLESRQYEMYLREQNKREDLMVPMAVKPDPSRSGTHVYLVLAGTQDPIGLLYRLRAHEWAKEPITRVPVFDGRKFYEVQARRESVGTPLTVAAGNFVVTRIALTVFQGGQELPNLKVWVSLGQDAARTPALIEADAPFGTVRAELTARGQ
jgi:Protein of unknown function (DUF3108)